MFNDKDGKRPRGPPGGALIYVHRSQSVLLGSLLGVSSTMKYEVLSVPSYPVFFEHVFHVFVLGYFDCICCYIIFFCFIS